MSFVWFYQFQQPRLDPSGNNQVNTRSDREKTHFAPVTWPDPLANRSSPISVPISVPVIVHARRTRSTSWSVDPRLLPFPTIDRALTSGRDNDRSVAILGLESSSASWRETGERDGRETKRHLPIHIYYLYAFTMRPLRRTRKCEPADSGYK